MPSFYVSVRGGLQWSLYGSVPLTGAAMYIPPAPPIEEGSSALRTLLPVMARSGGGEVVLGINLPPPRGTWWNLSSPLFRLTGWFKGGTFPESQVSSRAVSDQGFFLEIARVAVFQGGVGFWAVARYKHVRPFVGTRLGVDVFRAGVSESGRLGEFEIEGTGLHWSVHAGLVLDMGGGMPWNIVIDAFVQPGAPQGATGFTAGIELDLGFLLARRWKRYLNVSPI